MNKIEINPEKIREKILTELNKINLERIPLQNKEENYSHLNNYGYLNLKRLTPQMVQLSNEIKYYYTKKIARINNTNYRLLVESFKHNINIRRLIHENRSQSERARTRARTRASSRARTSSRASSSRKRESSSRRRESSSRKRESSSRRRSSSSRKRANSLIPNSSRIERPLDIHTGGRYYDTDLTIRELDLIDQGIIPGTTMVIVFFITDEVTANTYLFDTTELTNMKLYKKCISPETYDGFNNRSMSNIGIFDAYNMLDNEIYKYSYKIKNYHDVRNNMHYDNMNFNNILFDKEIFPDTVNYYYLYSNDLLDNNNTKFVKYSKLRITDDDVTSMKCYTTNWDRILNPYLYDNLNYWTATGNGELVINNSNPPTNYVEPTLNLPFNCRTVMDQTTHLPKPVDRPVLQEEINNKIENYYKLFFNKGRLTENNTVLFTNRRSNMVYRGMTRPFFNIVQNTPLLLQSYTSTTLKYSTAEQFAYNGGASIDPYVYQFTFDSGIPYISYDNSPYISEYGLQEEEVLFPINCYVTLVGPPSIRPFTRYPTVNYKLQRIHISWDLDLCLLEEHNTQLIKIKMENKFLGYNHTDALQKLIEIFPQITIPT